MHPVRIVVIMLLSGFAAAAADVVHLSDGKTVEGKADDLGERVRIVTSAGSVIVLPKSAVVEIERTPDPPITFAQLLAKVKSNDAEGYFELALWCDEHHLSDKYVEMLQKTLEIKPDHAEAHKRLDTYNKFGKPLPMDEEVAQGMSAQYGPSFRIQRTPHYLICHDCDDVFVLGRTRLLEKVYEAFYRFSEGKGFELDAINARLKVVLFNTQKEYIQHVPGKMGWAAGFYAHNANCVYFYNAIHDSQTSNLREEASSVPAGPLRKEDRLKAASAKRNLANLEKFKADQNIEITVHEATHQLTFNLRLLDPKVDNPAWVVEGVACYFAPPKEGEWEGPGQVDRARLSKFRAGGYFLSLDQLLANDSMAAGFSPGSYFSAWAFTSYLLRDRPKDFADYLRRLRSKPRDVPISHEEKRADFQACFGSDPIKLRTDLKAFVQKLK